VNGDLGEAFRRLQTRLRRNRVTQEVSRQKRHEKKGVKRRRLSSERWRRVFANEVFIFWPFILTATLILAQVRKKVQLVSTIRRRGAY
jgi:ribosomal protein S21